MPLANPSLSTPDADGMLVNVPANVRRYNLSSANGEAATLAMPSMTAVNGVINGFGRRADVRLDNLRLTVDGITSVANNAVSICRQGRTWVVSDGDEYMGSLVCHIMNRTVPHTLTPSVSEMSDPLGWVDDYSAFQTVYSAVNDTVHPAASARLLGDFHNRIAGNPMGTRTFGLEIEVDFPDSQNWGQERTQLAERMFAAGLAFDDECHRWHSAGRRMNPDGTVGYSRARNGWSVEFDRSVDDCNGLRGCEIVSPILTDSEETWNDLRTIFEMVKDLGGKTTYRTGLHINVGGEGINSRSIVNLARMSWQFDDLLVRIAHTPEVGPRHRGRGYCQPTWYSETSSGARHIDYNGHTSAINMHHITESARGRASASSRLEFRMFDGTLEVGRVQTYVTLCMAMIAAADNGDLLELSRETGGSHVNARNGGRARRLSGDAWKNDTMRVRQFVDFLRLPADAAEAVVICYKNSRWMVG